MRPKIKTKPKEREAFDDIRQMLGIPLSRDLDLASGMRLDVSRIGYPDEGLRVKVYINSPHRFSAEVQLSRRDAEWLLARLTAELADPKNANLPVGAARGSEDPR